ncbi:hypothetical protein [Nocardia sp. NPDC019255]|uniref:hypothetical protein n=1 Tax=Nocardia sp. NPDC019255 TaxID=3154591 RepID=UPI003407C9F3
MTGRSENQPTSYPSDTDAPPPAPHASKDFGREVATRTIANMITDAIKRLIDELTAE